MPATGTYVLTWDAVADPTVSGYHVYYGTNPLNTGRIGGVIPTDGPSLEFVPADHGMQAGQTLYMAVTAVSGSGMESAASEPVSIPLQ